MTTSRRLQIFASWDESGTEQENILQLNIIRFDSKFNIFTDTFFDNTKRCSEYVKAKFCIGFHNSTIFREFNNPTEFVFNQPEDYYLIFIEVRDKKFYDLEFLKIKYILDDIESEIYIKNIGHDQDASIMHIGNLTTFGFNEKYRYIDDIKVLQNKFRLILDKDCKFK